MATEGARPPAGADDDLPELEFEAAMERLEAIVAQLEGGDLKLAEALSLYEEGVRLARVAQRRLEGAEGRIEALLADGTVTDVQPEERALGGA
jgi:exodeoxyribonuclease VII small subunit